MTSPNTPVWQAPAQPGMLSNKRGSNTSTDAIAFAARYSHPLGAVADPPSAVQVQVYRTVVAGTPQPAELAWDSTVKGTLPYTSPAGVPAPVNSGVTGGVPSYATCVATNDWGAQDNSIPSLPLNRRVYCTFGTYRIYSAPITSAGGLGSWRLELDLLNTQYRGSGQLWASLGPPTQLLVLGKVPSGGDYISAFAVDSLSGHLSHRRFQVNLDFSLTIQPDTDSPALTSVVGVPQICPGPLDAGYPPTHPDGSQDQFALALGAIPGTSTASAVVRLITFSGADGHITVIDSTTTAIPVALKGVMPWYDPVNSYWYVAGGNTGAADVATIYKSAYAWPYSAWSTLATGLPAARSRGVVMQAWSSSNRINIFGGWTSAAQTTCWYILPASLGGAWSVSANALPNAMYDMGLAAMQGAGGGPDPVVLLGGSFGQVNSMGARVGTTGPSTWRTLATALVAADLGVSGGTLTVNADGSVDLGWAYGGFGASPQLATLLDGDQVQVGVTFWDQVAGDPSPTSYTTVKIGQPPTLASIAPANASTVATGRPVASFTVNPGVGGAQEKSYRIRATQGGNPVFDTGVLYGGANAVNIRPARGQSLGNLAYALILDVASLDVPMPGSSASVTSSTTFNGPSTAAPSVPTSLAVAPNPANGWTLLSWVDQVANTGWARIYKKAAGATDWILYKDNQVSLGAGVAHSFQAMEEIAFGVAYDYAVSSVDSTGVESALATVLDIAGRSKLIPPKQPSDTRYSIMLHVVGNGPAQKVGLQIVVLGSRGHAATVVTEQDAQAVVGFGNLAPTIRTGIYNYRRVDLKPIFQGAVALAAIEAVMLAAMAGSTICYRDTLGTIIYCGPATARTRREGRAHEDDLSLIETSFAYAA